jgi:hypothetical protein
MTIEKNEVFELAFRFITETSENIFLTGKAGTGKTTFLKYLKDNCTKNMVVAAPTGVAAINAGGVTLHSLFQLPFQPFLPTAANREELLKKLKYNKQRLNLLRKMEVLVIDEISMVRADVMDALDCILRSVRRNYDAPFGGIQLLCIGDLHQLPPVAQNHEWEMLQNYYSSPFFFNSLAIQEQQPVLIELNKIYRQKEQDFVDLLNSVRTNSMTDEDFETLHSRYNPTFVPFVEDKFITLTSHNKQAELINNSEIQKLLSAPKTYTAEIEDDFPESMYPAEASLMLKVGAQVMFLKNDLEKRFFNGKIGVVSKLENDKIFVEADGKEIEVFTETWENKKYTLNKADGKLLQETVGGFTQFPLRLAWAITIHKSQGLTFDKVMIDAGAAFSSGQVYVALSRCTSLNGIVLLSKIASTAIYSNENVERGQLALTVKGLLADRFAGARQVYTQQILEELFAFEDLYHDLAALKESIFHHKLKLNNGAIEWIEELFASFEAERLNGAKFNRHINAMLKEDAVIETNTALQDRLAAAANHFVPKLRNILELVKKHPLITEHKEVSEPINEVLNIVALCFYKTHYFIGYCSNPFSLLGYLKHKLNYAELKYNISCYASSKQAPTNSNLPNEELYQSLKRWRDLICEDEDTPVFMVATHAMLLDICTYLPVTKRNLLLISGFGKAKVDKYGDEIIDAVRDYCDRYNLSGNITPQKITTKKAKAVSTAPPKIDTKTSTYELYKAGKTIEEIAKERNLVTQTIEGHLAAFIETGLVHIDNFVNEQDFTTIANALKTRGEKTLTEIKEQLPKASFGEIRMVEAALKFEEGK